MQAALVGSTNGPYSAVIMSESRDPTPEAPQPPPVSLRELSQAFAEAMGGRGAAPAEPEAADGASATPAEAEQEGDEGRANWQSVPLAVPPGEAPPEGEMPLEETGDACPVSPPAILEAMLFVGNPQNEPLTAERAAGLMRGVEPEEIAGLVEQLNRGYAEAGCPYEVAIEGAGYRMRLRSRFGPLRNRFYGRVREARLSQAAVDVLAIVAYRQPLTADEVSKLRDRPSGHLLAQLVRRQLLEVERPPENRRTLLYRTTDRFLQLFGLEAIDELPQAEDLERR